MCRAFTEVELSPVEHTVNPLFTVSVFFIQSSVCMCVYEWVSELAKNKVQCLLHIDCVYVNIRGHSVNALFVPDCCFKCWRSLVMLIVYRLVKVFKFFISLTSLNTTYTAYIALCFVHAYIKAVILLYYDLRHQQMKIELKHKTVFY